MSITPISSGAYQVDGLFESDTNRYIRNAGIYIQDENGDKTQVDSITLDVYDSESTLQYSIDNISGSPIIVLDAASLLYYVDSIDITGFVDGDITLSWIAELDGYYYTYDQTVVYNTEPDITLVYGATTTIQDSKCVINQAKVFSCRVVDSLGNRVGYGVRAVFHDTLNASTVETATATQVSSTSDLWQLTHTISSSNYNPDLTRYELYWEVQLESGGSWYEVENSRVKLEVYQQSVNATTGYITHCTNTDIRLTFPDIDNYLKELNPNQAEREIILNQARENASIMITHEFRFSVNRDTKILKLLEMYEVYRDILMKSHSFAKFSVADGQLAMIDRKIKQLRLTINGSVSSIRIGPRL